MKRNYATILPAMEPRDEVTIPSQAEHELSRTP